MTSKVVSTLVIWKLDRLSRGGIEQVGSIVDEIADVGGRLVSVMDRLDTTEPESSRLLLMLAEFARAESSNLSLRVRSAKDFARVQGKWIGGSPPYGLINKGGRLLVDPETGTIVREIAQRMLKGETLTGVTTWLNSSAIPAPRGGPWNVGTVAQLLRGPATAGLLPETVKREDGRHTSLVRPWRDPSSGEPVSIMADGQEPLISPVEQAEIISNLRQRREASAWAKGAERPRGEGYLLTGLLFCAGCGGRLSRQGNSYRCQKMRLGRSCEAPGGAYQVALDEAVTSRWMSRVITASPDDPFTTAVAERWFRERDPEAHRQRACILTAVREHQAALASLKDPGCNPEPLSRGIYESLAAPILSEIEELERRLSDHPLPHGEVARLLDRGNVAGTWAQATIPERRDLLKLALDKVHVSQGVRGRRFEPDSRLTFLWVDQKPVPGPSAS